MYFINLDMSSAAEDLLHNVMSPPRSEPNHNNNTYFKTSWINIQTSTGNVAAFAVFLLWITFDALDEYKSGLNFFFKYMF